MAMETDSNNSAEDLRLRGNHEFSQKNYADATALYSAALSLNLSTDERKLVLLNRAASNYQTLDFEESLEDAQEAWSLSNYTSVKACFRLAKTCFEMRKWQACKEWIQKGVDLLDKEGGTQIHAGNSSSTKETTEESARDMISQQRQALEDLWKKTLDAAKEPPLELEKTIVGVKRPVSIREFKIEKDLGVGNFSEIQIACHKVTGERFALKRIAKKRCEELAKRQHPNVFNEVAMERRILKERLPPHPRIVRLFHAFSDYNTVFYLQELHSDWADLWSELRQDGVMVGCHRSCAVVWMYQLVDALEHMHKHGIVHRDIKPENILLDRHGNVIVIDFGTAKDLLQIDLNGPEFVGTPDFMPPEAVNGTSGIKEAEEAAKKGEVGAGCSADLWALGCMLYILETGMTPFWNTSPYLAFLRIKRGILFRPVGVVDDDTWDLIDSLVKVEPSQRLGADAFTINATASPRRMNCKEGGYDIIRNHPYFSKHHSQPEEIKSLTPVPSLRDLCVRGVADMVEEDSHDVSDKYAPGDGSSHDLLRLDERDRDAVYHVLDRRKQLGNARILERFSDIVTARVDRVRPRSHDVMGYTQMNDDQGKAPHQLVENTDPYAEPVTPESTTIVQLTNALFDNDNLDDDCLKMNTKLLKRSVAVVNRERPRLVMVTAKVPISQKIRKLLARINDSIPVVVHTNSNENFFTCWIAGIQILGLPLGEVDYRYHQWLRQHLEQARLSKHPLFVFVNGDPTALSQFRKKQLARGRALAIFGVGSETEPLCEKISYSPNEMVDDASIKSTDSEEDEGDVFSSQIHATKENGLRWITVDPEPDSWQTKWDSVSID